MNKRKGRPVNSVLDEHRKTIISMLHAGVEKRRIAGRFGVTPGALSTWLRTRKLTHVQFDPMALEDWDREESDYDPKKEDS